ncbi:hypothetical protein [Salibacterium lacus]|uniref:Uncharacterized protein n=1 Tax=Salibacterium lacus TaxID=1898109 RepID=A0ABW5SZ82_9BACI
MEFYSLEKSYVHFFMRTVLRSHRESATERIQAMDQLDKLTEMIGHFDSIEELQKYLGTNNGKMQREIEAMTDEEWEEFLLR